MSTVNNMQIQDDEGNVFHPETSIEQIVGENGTQVFPAHVVTRYTSSYCEKSKVFCVVPDSSPICFQTECSFTAFKSLLRKLNVKQIRKDLIFYP